MQLVTEIALEKALQGAFSRLDLECWLGGSADRQSALLKRALAAGEVLRIHRGLYCLAGKYLRQQVNPFELAQRICGPSYISLESALSYHGWIPEAVYTITSVSLGRSREFDTPLGHFSFARVPQETLYAEVSRIEAVGGSSFLLACPLKALADYVYVHKCDWSSIHPVLESLRVDEAALRQVDPSSFDSLAANYRSRRVRQFLRGLRKELAP